MPLKGRGGVKRHFPDSKVTNGYWEGSGHTSAPSLAFAVSFRVLDGHCHGQHRSPHLHGTTITRGYVQMCVCVYIYIVAVTIL